MNRWAVTNPWIFFGIGGAIVAYLLFMMVRRRMGERDNREEEVEL
jgi:phosphate/sulfate permease